MFDAADRAEAQCKRGSWNVGKMASTGWARIAALSAVAQMYWATYGTGRSGRVCKEAPMQHLISLTIRAHDAPKLAASVKVVVASPIF